MKKTTNGGLFITARLGSNRLPNKHILKIQDKYCIEYVIERVKRAQNSQNIIMCTTTLDEDDILCDIACKYGIEYYRGSVKDKLDRWFQTTKKFGIDFFITVDADNLFYEPELIDLAFEQYERTGADFIEWNQENLICGAFTYGIKTEALKKVCETKKTDNTEMMWVLFDPKVFKIEKLENTPNILRRPEIRATLDYKEDFLFFKRIIEHFGHSEFSLKDVVQYLDDHPDVIKINQFRSADWINNQKTVISKMDFQRKT